MRRTHLSSVRRTRPDPAYPRRSLARVLRVERAELADGTSLDHDVALLATGLVASPLVHAWGLGDAPGIPVRATLQHPDLPDVYAAGDCAAYLPRPLPRVGVHGVRQGPVLLEPCSRGPPARTCRRTRHRAGRSPSSTSEPARDWPCAAAGGGAAGRPSR